MTNTPSPRHPVDARTALDLLRTGNERFARGDLHVGEHATPSRRAALTSGQSPFAVVLSCSDSRVPSELIFDCGLGDLFVVRVAGNIAAPSLIGSVEFAAATFGTELVVVMGHTRCGAIAAALAALRGGPALSDNLQDIVARITPSIAELARVAPADSLVSAATRANVRATADRLRHGSRILEERASEGRLAVVGAEYSLETGKVDFFDVPPDLPRG